VEVDDLIQSGMIGLLDAAKHYSATKGANFETYAGIRIRAQCWTSAQVRLDSALGAPKHAPNGRRRPQDRERQRP